MLIGPTTRECAIILTCFTKGNQVRSTLATVSWFRRRGEKEKEKGKEGRRKEERKRKERGKAKLTLVIISGAWVSD
jgi:hypothetical protein